VIARHRDEARDHEDITSGNFVAIIKRWPRSIINIFMRAVRSRSLNGLDLVGCEGTLTRDVWEKKELRVCVALELLAMAADEKHKIAAKVLAMVRPECYLHIHDTWKKSDNKNKLKERLLAPHGAAPIQQARARASRVWSMTRTTRSCSCSGTRPREDAPSSGQPGCGIWRRK
jgi:hypothetical protein